ncbi:carboxy terminal-processing peptidase, partial [Klebsiella pneumoniae]
TQPDNYLFDREGAAWPKDEGELNELWRQRVKFDALSLKLSGKEWPEIKELLGKRYNNAIKRMSQTESEDVFQLFMNSFARAIEPHTSYLSPRSAD